jgi:hypothetical protein
MESMPASGERIDMTAKELQKLIRKYQRDCRVTTEAGRRKKAYRIPGTIEAGQWEMLHAMLRRAEK